MRPRRRRSLLRGGLDERLWQLFRERLQRTVRSGRQNELREETGHVETGAEVAEPGLWALAGGDCKGQLGISAPGCSRQREGAAEAWVDVRDAVCPVRLPEALDIRRPDEADGLGDMASELDELVVRDRHPFDRLAALGLDHRAGHGVQAARVEI